MKIRNGALHETFQTLVSGLEKIPNYLIGDPAYHLTPYFLKEYGHCINNEQVVSNNILRSARNPIKCAFGKLIARWGILTRKMGLKLEIIPVVIYACFALHKICKDNNNNNSYIDQELVKSQIESIKKKERTCHTIPDPVFSYDMGKGKIKKFSFNLQKFVKFKLY